MGGVVTINDRGYPRLLKEINSPPEKLYYKGKWDTNIFEHCLAVVGSRRMTTYGKLITTKLVREIAEAGATIVSGFMFGIDATAHKAAIEAGGRTIAVMPCGIDIIHPEYQKSLYKEILQMKGLIISEFESTFPPALWTYPKRNRIMAGVSKATMVVEAGSKSGALITAGFAKDYKRKLFAVPGPLTSLLSKGTSQLIKEGAEIVTSAEDVLGAIYKSPLRQNRVRAVRESPTQQLNELEQAIVKKLQEEPLGIDVLTRSVGAGYKSPLDVSEIGSVLSLMQLKGLIFEEKSKYYIKTV
jgi:DNA processing protein